MFTANDSRPADDNNVCNGVESCSDGMVILDPPALDCVTPHLNNPCSIGFCHPLTGCQIAQVANGTPCDINIQCTAANVCLNGECECTGIIIAHDRIPTGVVIIVIIFVIIFVLVMLCCCFIFGDWDDEDDETKENIKPNYKWDWVWQSRLPTSESINAQHQPLSFPKPPQANSYSKFNQSHHNTNVVQRRPTHR